MKKWIALYHEAMTEFDPDKLPLRLDTAIDAVLDEIEDTPTRPNSHVDDLTKALDNLRSRRKEAERWQNRAGTSNNDKAA
jgi:hypothetical protein